MKGIKLLAFLLCGSLFYQARAADGYDLKVKFTDVKDSIAYLAHYYAKPLPTIYKIDSARFDKNGVASFKSNKETLGGIYMVLLTDKKTYFEFLLNNGDKMTITATAAKLPGGVQYTNSPENERFSSYIGFLNDFGQKQQSLTKQYYAAKTATDSARISNESNALGKELSDYRRDYAAKYPGTLMTSIFTALEVPQVPAGKHLLPNGQIDTNFEYDYYKAHYWDKFNFRDDRLMNTPVYDAKLEEYINRLVQPWPDSMKKEADMLLAKTRGQKELFKYTLHWLMLNSRDSKVMGMDEVFVHLIENYYMKGDAYWLSKEMLAQYVDRAQKIAPNVLGNVAPDITMVDINNKKQSLLDVKSKYTILVFWSPECGSCVTEVPKIDSLRRTVLKNKDVQVFAVKVDGEEKIWKDAIDRYKLDSWMHVWDPERKSRYREQYDVYGWPLVYVLDEKKIIRGKKLDHTNIVKVIEMLEEKQKNNKG